jgi:hypothetical protein
MYFDRGAGPLLTILLPSRHRFDMLSHTIDTFIEKARDPRNLEIIIKLDEDDSETIKRISELRSDSLIKIIISPRLNGYASLHEYTNEMVKLATGDWVLFTNDDSTMETAAWDTMLENISPADDFYGSKNLACVRFNCLWRKNGQVTSIGKNEFPAVRRSVCNSVGYFALQTHVDSFIHLIYDRLNANIFSELSINHSKNDINDHINEQTTNAARSTSAAFFPFMEQNLDKFVEEHRKLL